MNVILRIVLSMAVLASGGRWVTAQQSIAPIYTDLRNLAFGIAEQPSDEHSLQGAIFEIGTEDGAITVVAVHDGAASIYFSNGGGRIGAQASEAVQREVKKLLTMAETYRGSAEVVTERPLPGWGRAQFYLLGAGEVRRIEASTEEMVEGHAATPLFHQASTLIGEVQKIGEP